MKHARFDVFHIIGIGEQYDNGVIVARGLYLLAAEREQRLAELDLVSVIYEALEAVAVHTNGIDTDVDKHFHAVLFKADGMFGFKYGSYGTVERSDNKTLVRDDTYAFSEYSGCESLIITVTGNSFAETYCRKNNLKYVLSD